MEIFHLSQKKSYTCILTSNLTSNQMKIFNVEQVRLVIWGKIWWWQPQIIKIAQQKDIDSPVFFNLFWLEARFVFCNWWNLCCNKVNHKSDISAKLNRIVLNLSARHIILVMLSYWRVEPNSFEFLWSNNRNFQSWARCKVRLAIWGKIWWRIRWWQPGPQIITIAQQKDSDSPVSFNILAGGTLCVMRLTKFIQQ